MISRNGHPMRAVRIGLMACVVGTALAGSSARADFQFSPEGNGTTFTTRGFTPAPGNALAQGGQTAIANFLSGSGDTTFQLYYQSSVTAIVTPTGPFTPPGLGTPGSPGSPTYELTVAGSITEVVTGVNLATGEVSFALANSQQAQSGLQIYFGTGPNFNSNPLAGTGFNDGTLILSATPQFSSAGATNTFRVANPATTVGFDQFGGDDYGGKQTVVGQGGFGVDFHVTSTNSAFFVTNPTVIGLEFAGNSSTIFNLVDPSMQFTGLGPGGTNVIPDLGGPAGVNGRNGPDFQFTTVGTIAEVPEPASFALTGLGLIGMAALRRRMRSRG
jgi:hypothetical protein